MDHTGQIYLPDVVARPARGGPALPTIDARGACALALVQYLERLEFVRWGGDTIDTPFKLRSVREEWPEPDQPVDYPSASIIDANEFEMNAHAFLPTPLEHTANRYGDGTVLWKLAEGVATLQVDFWADDNHTREAIAARLPSAFAPGEDGYRVILCGSCRYFDLAVRASLLSYRRVDTVQSAFPREKRLLAQIRCEVDVVDLRCVSLLAPDVRLPAVGEDVVPIPGPPQVPAKCK